MNTSSKFTVLFIAATLSLLTFTACFTSASARTKKIAPDGTVTESCVKLIGTGDKASQIAAEGMLADGTDADFSAGVRNAAAEQKSTGIDGALKGLSELMIGAAQFAQAIQNAKTGAALAQIQSTQPSICIPESEVVSEVPDITGALPTEDFAGVSLKAKIAEAKSTGKPLIVIAGNTGCGYCTKLDSLLNASPEIVGNSDYIFYRETSPWATNKAAKWTGNGKFPVLRVTRWADGKIVCDKKVNRPTSIADITEAIGNCYVK